MEGITGYTYRNVYCRHFENFDRYYTPFIPAHKKFGNKYKAEILPENNKGLDVVPQIMIGNSEELKELEALILPYGYEELNINAGCPSGTVVGKNRGSGLLRDASKLDSFLEDIFDNVDCELSIKTRLGWGDYSEWEELAKVIGRYPFTEVIIHARVREEFYNGKPHIEAMQIADEYIKVPKCYNGDIYAIQDVKKLQEVYPWIDRIMIGRGILSMPTLLEEIKDGFEDKTKNVRIAAFMDDLFETYLVQFGSEINTLYHMKELWSHLGKSYPNHEKALKTIRKTKSKSEYKAAVEKILK